MNKLEFFREMIVELEKFYEALSPYQNFKVPKLEGIDLYGVMVPFHDYGGDWISWQGFAERHDLEKRIRAACEDRRTRLHALNTFRKMKRLPDAQTAEITGLEKQLVEDYRAAKNRHKKLIEDRNKAGVFVIDVMGHYDFAGPFLTARIHDLFRMGTIYELKENGHITPFLFDNIDARLTLTSGFKLLATMIYGEISSDGVFKCISAGHPNPFIFSYEFNRFMDTSFIKNSMVVGMPELPLSFVDREKFPEITKVRPEYVLNTITLKSPRDIILLYTDGLSDRENAAGETFAPNYLEQVVRECKDLPAEEMCKRIIAAAEAFANPSDDTTLVVIKRTG